MLEQPLQFPPEPSVVPSRRLAKAACDAVSPDLKEGTAPQVVENTFHVEAEERCRQLERALSVRLAGASEIVWEVGCGHGHFLTAYAAAHPGALCIGIDLIGERIARAERKRQRANAGNLHFLKAEALEFLATLPAGVRLRSIFLLFPDPWPKRRHHKNRLMRPEFLHAAARRAGPDARLHFRTDHAGYFAAASRFLTGSCGWEAGRGGEWPFEQPTVFQERAAEFYSVVARRCATPS